MSAAERRLNLLTGDWVLVSPQRLSRPWRGEETSPATEPQPGYDPDCPLCPGNARAGGATNPAYEGVFVFDNDFPALGAADPPGTTPHDPLLVAEAEAGVCRVVCYSPDHGRALAQMPHAAIRAVVDAWAAQSAELVQRSDIAAVTVFENRGPMMGASNPHPHSQIWATSSVPNELAREDARQRAWFEVEGEPLLAAYLRRELAAGERVVLENDGVVVVMPYWAAWPFETLILPRRSIASLPQLADVDRRALADALGRLMAAYDALFDTPFPYSMGFHQAPARTVDAQHFTLHGHVYPPLLRSARVRKFMVGFELLAMPQRDVTPEEAAARLRAVLQS